MKFTSTDRYVAPEDLTLAVNAAVQLERPLLVKGEPGTGKTILAHEIAKAGGKPMMFKTGHSLIKTKAKQEGALVAGEMSGHIFFADRYYGYDDALYAAVRLLSVLTTSSRSLTAMISALPPMVNTPELRIDCADDRKFGVIEEVRGRLRGVSGITVQDIDGVRVSTDDGWWLLRASNTQDVLVARCEAADAAGLERLKRAVVEQVEAILAQVDRVREQGVVVRDELHGN